MANVAEQFRAINFYVTNRHDITNDAANQYAGRLEEFHPARLMIMTHEYHGGAMDTPVLLDMGMEALTARAIINGYHGNLLNSFGLADANAVNCEARGALEDYDGEVRNITFKMTGNIIDMPFGRIRGRGEVPKTIIQIACSNYQIIIDGTEHIYIDALGMIRRIGGIDRLEALRAAIGVN